MMSRLPLETPFPGKLFNAPDSDDPGDDVYAGCEIDYRGKDVSADNFIGLLLGDGTSRGNGRTLDITDADDLFVLHAGYCAPGSLHFPDQN